MKHILYFGKLINLSILIFSLSIWSTPALAYYGLGVQPARQTCSEKKIIKDTKEAILARKVNKPLKEAKKSARKAEKNLKKYLKSDILSDYIKDKKNPGELIPDLCNLSPTLDTANEQAAMDTAKVAMDTAKAAITTVEAAIIAAKTAVNDADRKTVEIAAKMNANAGPPSFDPQGWRKPKVVKTNPLKVAVANLQKAKIALQKIEQSLKDKKEAFTQTQADFKKTQADFKKKQANKIAVNQNRPSQSTCDIKNSLMCFAKEAQEAYAKAFNEQAEKNHTSNRNSDDDDDDDYISVNGPSINFISKVIELPTSAPATSPSGEHCELPTLKNQNNICAAESAWDPSSKQAGATTDAKKEKAIKKCSVLMAKLDLALDKITNLQEYKTSIKESSDKEDLEVALEADCIGCAINAASGGATSRVVTYNRYGQPQTQTKKTSPLAKFGVSLLGMWAGASIFKGIGDKGAQYATESNEAQGFKTDAAALSDQSSLLAIQGAQMGLGIVNSAYSNNSSSSNNPGYYYRTYYNPGSYGNLNGSAGYSGSYSCAQSIDGFKIQAGGNFWLNDPGSGAYGQPIVGGAFGYPQNVFRPGGGTPFIMGMNPYGQMMYGSNNGFGNNGFGGNGFGGNGFGGNGFGGNGFGGNGFGGNGFGGNGFGGNGFGGNGFGGNGFGGNGFGGNNGFPNFGGNGGNFGGNFGGNNGFPNFGGNGGNFGGNNGLGPNFGGNGGNFGGNFGGNNGLGPNFGGNGGNFGGNFGGNGRFGPNFGGNGGNFGGNFGGNGGGNFGGNFGGGNNLAMQYQMQMAQRYQQNLNAWIQQQQSINTQKQQKAQQISAVQQQIYQLNLQMQQIANTPFNFNGGANNGLNGGANNGLNNTLNGGFNTNFNGGFNWNVGLGGGGGANTGECGNYASNFRSCDQDNRNTDNLGDDDDKNKGNKNLYDDYRYK